MKRCTMCVIEVITIIFRKKKLIYERGQRQGYEKLNYACPSTLELINTKNGQFEGVLYTPHIGHDCSLKFINLTKTERTQIVGINLFLLYVTEI